MYLKFICLPQRYVFAVMGFLVTTVVYMIRESLTVTISSMVNQNMNTTSEQFNPDSCPDFTVMPNQNDVLIIQNLDLGIFDWDNSTQNSVSSAFTTGYLLSQFIGGNVAERIGGKKIMGICLAMSSISTFIIPIASKQLGSTALYVLRLVSGLASGVTVPVLLSMVTKWVPTDEQAFIASIILPGYLIGYVAGSWLGGLLVTTIGWESVFYIYGTFGAVCCCLWTWLVYSTPNEHPRITQSEKNYLNMHVTALIRTTKYPLDPLPLGALLRCVPFWGITIGYIGREWAFATFTIQLPQFMKEVLRLDISTSAFFQYMPYVCMWLAALLFGFSCDIIIKKQLCSVKNARKIFTAIGTIGAVVCIISVMYSGCRPTLAMFWMFAGMIFVGSFYSGCMISALDIAPNYAGSMVGALDNMSINSARALPGINSSIVTDALLRQWRLSLWIVIIVLLVSIVVYVYYVQADQVWWDDVRTKGYPELWSHGLFACNGVIDKNGKSVYKGNVENIDKNSEC